MKTKSFYFNELRECCYLVWDETGECAVIDPGFGSENEFGRLKKFIADESLKPVKILLTHGHFDHILGLEEAWRFWNVPVYFSRLDDIQIQGAPQYCAMLGLSTSPFTGEGIDVKDGDRICFGNTELVAIATPGHTEGGVCYLCEKDAVLFSGDTLFAGSIGRTDHIGGDYNKLIGSIVNRLMKLDGDITVLPGHGPATSIGYERATNPFLETY